MNPDLQSRLYYLSTRGHCNVQSLVLQNWKHAFSQGRNITNFEVFQSFEDIVNGSLSKSLLVSGININTSRREESFGEIGHNPLVTIIRMAKAKNFPVRACNHQPAFTTPIPSALIT